MRRGGGGGRCRWRDVEAVKYLLDTDVSFIPEVSLETHQVQGAGERPGPSSLGSLPSSGVEGFKQTNKVMTDCGKAVQEIHKNDVRDCVGETPFSG